MMRRCSVLVGLLLLTGFTALAQITVTNRGTIITVFNGTSIYLRGNYVNDVKDVSAIEDPQFILNGTFYVTGDITNKAAVNLIDPDLSAGTIVMNGPADQTLNGPSQLTLYDLDVNTSGKLNLARNVEIKDNIKLTKGTVNLSTFQMDLGSDGVIASETNNNYIFTTSSGVIRYTLSERPQLSQPLGNLGLRLDGDMFAGVVIRRGHAIQSTAGNGSIQRYYDIDLNTGDVVNDLQLGYLDHEIAGFTESDLAVFASYDGGLSWKKLGGVVNAGGNYVALTDVSINADVRLTLSSKSCAAPPVVDIGPATRDLCAGSTFVLDAGNAGSTYAWSDGSALRTLSVSAGGTYSVTVTNARGCEGTDAVVVTSRPMPVAAFTNSVACPTSGMTFTNTSTIASGTLTYAWDFADPASTTDVSTDTNPSYSYATAGSYQVQLVAASPYQCRDTLKKAVTVFPLPVPDFTTSNACFGQATMFTNISTIASGGMTYSWDLGDGTTSTQTNPQKQYAGVTTYTVKLTARSNANCVKDIIKAVKVDYTPAAAFTIGNACANGNVALANASSISNGAALTYAWDFGDASASPDATPTKAYATPGTYTVGLTVTSASGCTNTVTHPVDIYANPVASFSVGDQCQDKIFSFVNTSFAGQGTLTYDWNLADGQHSTALAPTHQYAAPGTYAVVLAVTNSAGCTNSLMRQVVAFPVPQADFTFANACNEQNVTFTNTSTLASGSMTYNWTLSDETTGSGRDFAKVFTTAGSYQVKLALVSDKGCQAEKTSPLTIYALPELNFGGTIGTCGTQYTLNAGNVGSTYQWSNGSTDQAITVTDNGTYSVKVTNAHACVAFESVDVTLKGEVIPHLGDDRTVCGKLVLDAGYPGSTYLWSTGADSRTLAVSVSGTYHVTVTDPNGCSGEDEVAVVVNPVPVVSLGNDVAVCADQTVVLDAGTDGNTYAWSDGSATRIVSPKVSNRYTVAVTNGFGCIGRDTVNVVLYAMPVNMLEASVKACDAYTLDAGNDGASYQWTDFSVSRQLVVTATGTYGVKVITPYGCIAQFTSAITVNISAKVDLGADRVLCYGETTLLDAGKEGDRYLWSDGSTNTTLNASKSGLYTVSVFRNNGCVTNDQVNVLVYPQITNTLKTSYFLCVNAPRELNAVSPQATRYEWYDASGLLTTDKSITITAPGAFRAVTYDAVGCKRVDEVAVVTDSDPITSRFLVSTFADVGDSLHFVQLSYPDPIVYDWDFKDGVVSKESDPTHIYYMAGDFDASLQVGDPGGCLDVKSKTITIRLLRSDGDDPSTDMPFIEITHTDVFPNPTEGVVNVGIGLNKQLSITLVLFDLNGKQLETRQALVKDDVVEFDLRGYAVGVYLIKVLINNEVRTMRVIKI